MTHTYEYPRPMVACTVICTWEDRVLLGLRKGPTEAGKWSLPGGFLNEGQETLISCALRELREETGIAPKEHWEKPYLVGESSRPGTDPRGHVINLVYRVHLARMFRPKLTPGDDIEKCLWVKRDRVLASRTDLAFDHHRLLKMTGSL